ncbi:GDP-mannose 4,6-dehydratase [Paenibacillus eucommiae]|uniref:GDP-mannose 4,6-dehydratase n=1 Tax=Paenibacillus eucommiae TaxID=1355755 RepID=A0ABS4IU83_9BACL|nr:GDP-mannose 4,6-dehydratase [Paenibacillus eucommiae]MBP1991147.1 GDP-mannose 4,6-dehydratase [Paenibacillus eucommiae]
MTVLITGICGMVGSHMCDYFYETNVHVVGTYYKPTTNIKEIKNKADLHECDVRYYLQLYNIISKYKPNRIFHLAAQSYPTVSWERPQETIETNVNGTINVFEAVKQVKKYDSNYDPVIVVACSSAEYGNSLTPENVPIKEEAALMPLHPYGVSKVAQDLLAYQYYQSDGLKSIRARIFNTTGPRKTNDASSDFCQRAVEIERGLTTNFRVGNIETKRAITDVRDLVKALVLLSKKGKHGEVYNISGAKVYQIREVLQIIKDIIDIDFQLEVDSRLLRPTDEPIIFGDSTKLIKETGWKQEYTLKQTLTDMITYWRDNNDY